MADALAIDRGPTDVALLDETIGDNLRRTIAAHGDNDAIVARHQGIRWTYAEFGERVDRLSAGLLGLGLEVGDRVGLWSPNYAEWTLVQYATANIGVILVNINPAYRTHELAYALNQSGCRMLVAAPSFKSSDYMEMVDQIEGQVPALERAVFLWEDEWDEIVAGAGGVDRRAVARAGSEPASRRPDQHPVHVGHDGVPEGGDPHPSQHPQQRLLRRPPPGLHQHRPAVHPGALLPLLRHGHGQPRMHHARGDDGHPRRRLRPGSRPRDRHRRAVHGAVRRADDVHRRARRPRSLGSEAGSYDLTSLRTGVMAGSPCPVEVMKACVDRMHLSDVTICYGMTETSPVSTQTLPDDSLHHRTATVGRAHPHVEIRIAESGSPGTGRTVARGVTGEFCTRGYSVMQGYWNEPERTAEAIDEDGWMHTGDLAVMADDGYVNIVGRIKDMVIRGGENIYPREIEEFLYTHPEVADVQVIGVPDAKYGEELMAWVKLAPRRDCRRGRAPCVLPRPDRPLQGAPLHPLRRRLPDDRHRQGAEVRDARAVDRRARPHRRRDRIGPPIGVFAADGVSAVEFPGTKHSVSTKHSDQERRLRTVVGDRRHSRDDVGGASTHRRAERGSRRLRRSPNP